LTSDTIRVKPGLSDDGKLVSVTSRNNERKIEAKYSVMQSHLHSRLIHVGCIGPGVDENLDRFHRWLMTQSKEIVGIDHLSCVGVRRGAELRSCLAGTLLSRSHTVRTDNLGFGSMFERRRLTPALPHSITPYRCSIL
jgi:hypothetical protein